MNGRILPKIKIQKEFVQGSACTTLLYSINMARFASVIHDALSGIQLINHPLRSLIYADDITFIVKTEGEFRNLFEIIEIFRRIAGISINTEKMQVLNMNSQISPAALEGIELDDQMKILGTIWSSNMQKR